MSTRKVFGPSKPSRLALMGIRFVEGEGGAAPVAPTIPVAPATPAPPIPAEDKTDWKAESRKWEARAKASSDAEQRLAEIEEEKKTDEQKVADRIAAAEKRATDLEVKATRAEVAAAKGVPVELLHGGTKEEFEAAADALIAFKGTTEAPTPPVPSVPTIGTSPQRTGNVPLHEQIAAAEAAGDRALVSQLKAVQLGSTN